MSFGQGQSYTMQLITHDLLLEKEKGKEVVLPYNSGKKIQGLAMPFLKQLPEEQNQNHKQHRSSGHFYWHYG